MADHGNRDEATSTTGQAASTEADFYNPDAIAEGLGDANLREDHRRAAEFVSRVIRRHIKGREDFGAAGGTRRTGGAAWNATPSTHPSSRSTAIPAPMSTPVWSKRAR